MVMEYLQGEDIAQLVTRVGALPIQDAVGYVLEACEAIAEAHALGIVHRDLKPANLFLAERPSGRPIVKVLDFGISKAPSGTKEAALTGTAALLGSPAYMSPEQLTAASKVDPRADIWALGVVLFELLTGAVPFNGDTMPELVGVILASAHPAIDRVRPDVPAELSAAIARCLEKKAADRFANVAELARAIAPFGPRRTLQSVERIEHVLGVVGEPYMRTEPAPALPPSTTGPGLGAVPRAEGITFTPTMSHATPARSGAGRFAIPAVVAVVALAGAAVFVVRGQSHATTTTVVAPVAAPSAAPPAPPSATLTPIASADPPATPSDTAPSAAPAPSTAPAATKAFGMQGGGRFGGWPRPTATAQPPTAAPTPTCHIVTYFDSDGTKHFKQECK